MVRSFNRLTLAILLSLTAAIIGCGPSTPKAPAKPDVPAAEKVSADSVPPGLADLSAEDRAAALKQRVCPVTGAVLGSMGAPIKVTIQDQTVFLCCEGCTEALKKDPEKYLAKLKENK